MSEIILPGYLHLLLIRERQANNNQIALIILIDSLSSSNWSISMPHDTTKFIQPRRFNRVYVHVLAPVRKRIWRQAEIFIHWVGEEILPALTAHLQELCSISNAMIGRLC